jgi:hypothetical protein
MSPIASFSAAERRPVVSRVTAIQLEKLVEAIRANAQPDAEPKGDLSDRAVIDRSVGRIRTFAEIAEREGKVERHIRLLAPLAFIPPRTLAAIIDGTSPHDATVTALAQSTPY